MRSWGAWRVQACGVGRAVGGGVVAAGGAGAGVAVPAVRAPGVPGVAGRVAAGVVAAGVASVGVGCGVGVAGAESVTVTGGDSCAFWKLSSTRTRKR